MFIDENLRSRPYRLILLNTLLSKILLQGSSVSIIHSSVRDRMRFSYEEDDTI